jgi:hypothetical protein
MAQHFKEGPNQFQEAADEAAKHPDRARTLWNILHPQTGKQPRTKQENEQAVFEFFKRAADGVRSLVRQSEFLRELIGVNKEVQKVLPHGSPEVVNLTNAAESANKATQELAGKVSELRAVAAEPQYKQHASMLSESATKAQKLIDNVHSELAQAKKAAADGKQAEVLEHLATASTYMQAAAGIIKMADSFCALPLAQRNTAANPTEHAILNIYEAAQRGPTAFYKAADLERMQQTQRTLVDGITNLGQADRQLRKIPGIGYDPNRTVQNSLTQATGLLRSKHYEEANKVLLDARKKMHQETAAAFSRRAKQQKLFADATIEMLRKQSLNTSSPVTSEHWQHLADGYKQVAKQNESAVLFLRQGKFRQAQELFASALRAEYTLDSAYRTYNFINNNGISSQLAGLRRFAAATKDVHISSYGVKPLEQLQARVGRLAQQTDAVVKALCIGSSGTALKPSTELEQQMIAVSRNMGSIEKEHRSMSMGLQFAMLLYQDAAKFNNIAAGMEAEGKNYMFVKALRSNASTLSTLALGALANPESVTFDRKELLAVYGRAWSNVGLVAGFVAGFGASGTSHQLWKQLAEANVAKLSQVFNPPKAGNQEEAQQLLRRAALMWNTTRLVEQFAVSAALKSGVFSAGLQKDSLDALSRSVSALASMQSAAAKGNPAASVNYSMTATRELSSVTEKLYKIEVRQILTDAAGQAFHGIAGLFFPPIIIADIAYDIGRNYEHMSGGELAVKAALGALSFVPAVGFASRLGRGSGAFARAGATFSGKVGRTAFNEALSAEQAAASLAPTAVGVVGQVSRLGERAEHLAGLGMVGLGIADFGYQLKRNKWEWNAELVLGAIQNGVFAATGAGGMILARRAGRRMAAEKTAAEASAKAPKEVVEPAYQAKRESAVVSGTTQPVKKPTLRERLHERAERAKEKRQAAAFESEAAAAKAAELVVEPGSDISVRTLLGRGSQTTALIPEEAALNYIRIQTGREMSNAAAEYAARGWWGDPIIINGNRYRTVLADSNANFIRDATGTAVTHVRLVKKPDGKLKLLVTKVDSGKVSKGPAYAEAQALAAKKELDFQIAIAEKKPDYKTELQQKRKALSAYKKEVEAARRALSTESRKFDPRDYKHLLDENGNFDRGQLTTAHRRGELPKELSNLEDLAVDLHLKTVSMQEAQAAVKAAEARLRQSTAEPGQAGRLRRAARTTGAVAKAVAVGVREGVKAAGKRNAELSKHKLASGLNLADAADATVAGVKAGIAAGKEVRAGQILDSNYSRTHGSGSDIKLPQNERLLDAFEQLHPMVRDGNGRLIPRTENQSIYVRPREAGEAVPKDCISRTIDGKEYLFSKQPPADSEYMHVFRDMEGDVYASARGYVQSQKAPAKAAEAPKPLEVGRNNVDSAIKHFDGAVVDYRKLKSHSSPEIRAAADAWNSARKAHTAEPNSENAAALKQARQDLAYALSEHATGEMKNGAEHYIKTMLDNGQLLTTPALRPAGTAERAERAVFSGKEEKAAPKPAEAAQAAQPKAAEPAQQVQKPAAEKQAEAPKAEQKPVPKETKPAQQPSVQKPAVNIDKLSESQLRPLERAMDIPTVEKIWSGIGLKSQEAARIFSATRDYKRAAEAYAKDKYNPKISEAYHKATKELLKAIQAAPDKVEAIVGKESKLMAELSSQGIL